MALVKGFTGSRRCPLPGWEIVEVWPGPTTLVAGRLNVIRQGYKNNEISEIGKYLIWRTIKYYKEYLSFHKARSVAFIDLVEVVLKLYVA